ncbi:MAG: acetylxylan esterase [Sedimentisphaerales bacterium]|nr:acetylxylan esterase [Sedimentisphaerales bacterium]
MRNNQAVVIRIICIVPALLIFYVPVNAANRSAIGPSKADEQLFEYFEAETKKLSKKCLRDINTLEDWQAKRPIYRKQLFEMLGLDPLPEKTDLKPVITGKVEHDEFTVENLYFQSRPGLYVTANLYIPKRLEKPAPAILYVCGHGPTKKNNISYGNKVSYQHHGAWFARHGYVCLVIDTLQMGEIEGIHHGTYRYDMWWWNSRGYSSAAVEAWNCIRSLDYLQSRKEVDGDRIGVTGRSGGGAYSWWISALDDRIKAAVPVAGITDLQNHVVDGCVEGHCDCMYIVNTYQWDYPLVASLVAPRGLLISNSDKDTIFPLDGVVRLHEKVRKIYRLYGADDKLGLQITEGPHKDTQELRVHAFVWFNRFLKGENPLIDKPAVPFFEPEQLKVFDELPVDEINTKIQESFVPKAEEPSVPKSVEEWEKQRKTWMKMLRKKSFRGWPRPAQVVPLDMKCVFSAEGEGIQLSAYDFTSQPHVCLRLYLSHKAGLNKPEGVILNVLDEKGWTRWLAGMRVGFENELSDYKLPEPNESFFNVISELLKDMNCVMACVAPRGMGPDAWNIDERKQVQIRRRFMLLGQTADGMRVWDVRRAIEALRTIDLCKESSVDIQAEGKMAGIALYASLFEPDISELYLWNLPVTHHDGPTFLNVLRYLDMPQAVAMAAERSKVNLYQEADSGWQFPKDVVRSLGWPEDRFHVYISSSGDGIYPYLPFIYIFSDIGI